MVHGTNNKEQDRKEFLIHMYDQMFNDINRHINIIWQPITVLFGSFALLAAGTKDILPVDIAVSLIILLDGWLIANLYDASYWYNRNLVIIANIERQFLYQSDLKNIQYYFGKHRKKDSMIRHIFIQWWLGVFTGSAILAFHFLSEVLKYFPHFRQMQANLHLTLLLPYLTAAVIIAWLAWFKKNREASYQEFLENSPGIDIDTQGIRYGVGHPIEQNGEAKTEDSK